MSETVRAGKWRILVIDDDETMRILLRRQLEGLGHEVLAAPTAEEGIELARDGQVAVVFCDVYMPGTDGHAFLSRSNRLGLSCSVVLMSGRGELDDVIGALREGAVDYLKKPWGAAELAEVVERAVALWDAMNGDEDRDLDERAETPEYQEVAPEVDYLTHPEALFDLPGPDAPSNLLLRSLVRSRPSGPFRENAFDEIASHVIRLPSVGALLARMFGARGRTPRENSAELLALARQEFGADHVWSYLSFAALREAFPAPAPGLRPLAVRIWRFSVARAMAMLELAWISQVEGGWDPTAWFCAGLVLDVGASCFLSAVGSRSPVHRKVSPDSKGLMAVLVDVHEELGARILNRWDLPVDLVEASRTHHADLDAKEMPPLSCALALGEAIATRIAGFGDPTGNRVLSSEQLARCAYSLGVGETSVRRLTRSLAERASGVWAAIDGADGPQVDLPIAPLPPDSA